MARKNLSVVNVIVEWRGEFFIVIFYELIFIATIFLLLHSLSWAKRMDTLVRSVILIITFDAHYFFQPIL